MPPIQQVWTRTLLLGVTAIALSSPFALLSAQASTSAQPKAISQQQTDKNTRRQQLFTPPPAPNNGRAGVSRGTATRNGSCGKVDIPLTALIPTYQTAEGTVPAGLTTSAHPTLWFYVPYEIKPERPAELRLETTDPATQAITQRTVLRLTQAQPGIVGVRIPASESPMTVGQRYDWTFVVQCDPKSTSANKFVELSLTRVQPVPLLAQQPPALSRERVVQYAAAGLWENAFTLLAQLRTQAPKDAQLARDWADLLQAIAVPNLATQPISMSEGSTN